MNIKELAELHWEYTKGVIIASLHQDELFHAKEVARWVELCHYLYVQAMVHGYKHKEDELK